MLHPDCVMRSWMCPSDFMIWSMLTALPLSCSETVCVTETAATGMVFMWTQALLSS